MMNHLWQSTLFAAVAWGLTLGLRGNRARLRYWVWLAASVKFLIPFSVLMGLGNRIEWRQAPAAPVFVEITNRASAVLAPVEAPINPRRTPRFEDTLTALWAIGTLAVCTGWLVRWRRASKADRVLEPGVFGLIHHRVRMPEGIEGRLTAVQMQSILAHELCHARYCDNLTGAVHMTVEALFWFHPLVWWIGARLIDERERACDEEVLRLGHDPDAYAEGILRVCKFYMESPVECVAGVTGSNLKQRIETILENRMPTKLTRAKRILLAAAASAAVAGPVLLGIWNAPPARAQTSTGKQAFAAATIKPAAPGQNGMAVGSTPSGDFRAVNQTLQNLVSFAYMGEMVDLGLVSGGPGWVKSARFDIQAKAEGPVPPADQRGLVQRLLADRFKLKVHEETKQLPVYALVLADRGGKLGPNIHRVSTEEAAYCDALGTQENEQPGVGKDGFRRCGGSGRGGIRLRGSPVAGLGEFLGELLGRQLIDRTGLQGRYDIDLLVELNWDHIVEGGPADGVANGALFSAMQDQLGLKLESARGPVRTIVIDSAEMPGEN